MSNGGIFPDIPGVDLAETQRHEIWSICLALAVAGTLFVFVRGLARWTQAKRVPLALDDYLILPALLFAIGTAACALEATNYGGGRHLPTLTLSDFIGLYKLVYAYTFLWIWALSFTKLSILAFYKRVFGPSIQLWICVGLTVGYFVSLTVSWALVCRPISFFWMEWITPEAPGYCFNVYKFDLGNAIANLIIDIAVLCVPLPTIAKLHMPLRQKIGVAGVLLLGSFVSVASIIRLKNVIYMNTNTTDISWSMGAVMVWSCVEPFVGIFCACLPTYPPLIRLLYRKLTGLPWASTIKSQSKSGLSYGQRSTLNDDKFGRSKVRRLGSDDELGLTNEISGPMSPGMEFVRGKGRSVDEEMGMGLEMGEIVVKREVGWSSVSDRRFPMPDLAVSPLGAQQPTRQREL